MRTSARGLVVSAFGTLEGVNIVDERETEKEIDNLIPKPTSLEVRSSGVRITEASRFPR